MAGKPKFTQNHYTTRQLAELLDVSSAKLLDCCAQGLVPGAQRFGSAWIIARSGAAFLAEWLPLRDSFGMLWTEAAQAAAIKVDPGCAQLQAEHAKQLQKARGRGKPPSRIKLADLLDIQDRLADGEPQDRIAADYKCHYSTISRIAGGSRRALGRKATRIAREIASN